MTVKNTIKRADNSGKSAQMVTYEANGMTVELSPQVVRDYLVSGDKERVTMQELVMFINLCKFNGLNPWLKEAYCVKYGNEPATIVTGKEAFEKRAENHPAHDGHKAGIIVIDADGEIVYRVGSLHLPDETIVGGWAEVWRKDQTESTRVEVSFDEYAGRRRDGSLNRQWGSKPGTMIRKVALVQALREAFPKTLGSMYSAEDQDLIEVVDVTPPTMQAEAKPEQIEQPAKPAIEEASAEPVQQELLQGDPVDGFFED